MRATHGRVRLGERGAAAVMAGANALAKYGDDRKSEDQGNNITLKMARGTRAARLKRDHPEIAEAVIGRGVGPNPPERRQISPGTGSAGLAVSCAGAGEVVRHCRQHTGIASEEPRSFPLAPTQVCLPAE